MARFAPDATLDTYLDKIATSTQMHICAGQPTNQTTMNANSLGSVAMAGGDFTKAAGTPNGRQVTVGAKNGVSITSSGTADHVALSDGTDLILVTVVTSQAVTSGNTADLAAWVVTLPQPTAPA
ncbi:MAG: hypothetical protein R3362_07640 [Rhodothermales bacterium]|nr:hypothetical protein [Rhodothermales bacterium]